MSKHLLSTTPSSRAAASTGSMPGISAVGQSAQPLIHVPVINSMHPASSASYLPNHLPNGFAAPDVAQVDQPVPKPPPKKTKKRRRKSESSDGSGAFSAPLDGSPRLIKKIGRVIQTVESERDLDIKVDAMLKNIKDKFHSKNSDSNAAFHEHIAPPTAPDPILVNHHHQPEHSNVGSPHNTGPTKTTAKRRSRTKKKLTDAEAAAQQSSASGFASPAETLTEPPPQHQQQQQQPGHVMFQFPINMTNSEAIAVASIAALGEHSTLDEQARPTPSPGHAQLQQPTPEQHMFKQNAVLSPHVNSNAFANAVNADASRKMLLDAGLSLLSAGNKVVAPPPYPEPPAPHLLPLEQQASGSRIPGLDPFNANVAAFGLNTDATGTSAPTLNMSANTGAVPVGAAAADASAKAKQRPRKRRRSSEKLSDSDIGKIVQLLKMANAQYFGEFINQLQAFAVGKNPDWMTQYPNIAMLMGLNRDSKERAKQILEYMRQQTGLLDPPEPQPQASVAKTTGPAFLDLPQAPAGLPQLNGGGGERLTEGTFIDSFQSFLHTKSSPTVSPGACLPSPAKTSRRQQRSRSQAQEKDTPELLQPQPPALEHLPQEVTQRRGSVGVEPPARTYPRVQRDWALFGIKSALISDDHDDRTGPSKSTILSLLKDQSIVERLKCNAIHNVEEVCKCDCVKTGACVTASLSHILPRAAHCSL